MCASNQLRCELHVKLLSMARLNSVLRMNDITTHFEVRRLFLISSGVNQQPSRTFFTATLICRPDARWSRHNPPRQHGVKQQQSFTPPHKKFPVLHIRIFNFVISIIHAELCWTPSRAKRGMRGEVLEFVGLVML